MAAMPMSAAPTVTPVTTPASEPVPHDIDRSDVRFGPIARAGVVDARVASGVVQSSTFGLPSCVCIHRCCSSRSHRGTRHHYRLPSWPRRCPCVTTCPCAVPITACDRRINDYHPGMLIVLVGNWMRWCIHVWLWFCKIGPLSRITTCELSTCGAWTESRQEFQQRIPLDMRGDCVDDFESGAC